MSAKHRQVDKETRSRIGSPLPRRQFLTGTALSLGTIVLGQLLGQESASSSVSPQTQGGVLESLHFPPRAKRVIYLFMSGGPSQLDMFDYKPLLNEKNGTELPDSVRQGQRLTGMSGNQASLPLAGSAFRFAQHGVHGAWFRVLLPQ